MRALLVALVIAQAGCFSIIGSVTGGIVADRINARRLAHAQHDAPLEAPAPPPRVLTEESRARCEQVRTNLAADASHVTNANAQHALILRLPNCMDPSWEFPNEKLPPRPLPHRAPGPEMISIEHGMLVGLGVGAVVDAVIFGAVVIAYLAHPLN